MTLRAHLIHDPQTDRVHILLRMLGTTGNTQALGIIAPADEDTPARLEWTTDGLTPGEPMDVQPGLSLSYDQAMALYTELHARLGPASVEADRARAAEDAYAQVTTLEHALETAQQRIQHLEDTLRAESNATARVIATHDALTEAQQAHLDTLAKLADWAFHPRPIDLGTTPDPMAG